MSPIPPSRWQMRSTAAVLALVFVAGLAAAQTGYFPPHSFHDLDYIDTFSAKWYAKHLKAMDEPSLWKLSKDGKIHAYRFLWLRSFHRPVAVRVIVNPDGTGTVITKMLNGAGGYEPGRLIQNQRRTLSAQETQALLSLIKEADFWSLPSFEKQSGVDGAQWITEGTEGGQYHVVDRWSPEVGKYRAIGLHFLIYLGRLRLLYQDVY